MWSSSFCLLFHFFWFPFLQADVFHLRTVLTPENDAGTLLLHHAAKAPAALQYYIEHTQTSSNITKKTKHVQWGVADIAGLARFPKHKQHEREIIPDVTDRESLITFAEMSWDAYLMPTHATWYTIDGTQVI